MSSPLTAASVPQTSAAEQSRMELQAKLNGIGGLNGRKLDPEAKAKKLREACEGFESIFIQKMWQEMRNTVPKANLLQGREERFWQDMYDQELSKSMTRAGGIGLADMMFEQLSRGLASASSSAAGNVQGAAFTPAAAPLISPAGAEATPAREPAPAAAAARQPAPGLVADIYAGEAPEVGREPAERPAQPSVPPAARRQELKHADTHTHQPGSRVSVSKGSSGMAMAYRASREAGDKLSAGAVRPSLYKPRTRQPAVEEPQTQAPEHGSQESLTQALEVARQGGGIQRGQNPMQLAGLVAEAKLRNSQAENVAAQAAEPVVVKKRFTTNIPANARAGASKGGDAIRMLNVDNVGVNSRQGKGLAAYHAAQEAAQPAVAPAQPVSPAPVDPLAASEPGANAASFAIPPLRAGELKS